MKLKIRTFFVLIAVMVFLTACSANNNNKQEQNVIQGDTSADAGHVKTFVFTGENFKFVMDGVDNPDLVVNKGDRVRIEFSSSNGSHDWNLDEFDARTKKVRDGEGSTFVEFVADKKGTFEYYCSLGMHRANGMWGEFIVE